MNAPEYLKDRQRHEELCEWFLAHVPENAGGTSIVKLPEDLEAQMNFAKIPAGSPIERLRHLMEFDIAATEFAILYQDLPPELQRRLTPGENFAVGTLNSAEFNGTADSVLGGHGAVVLIPIGAVMLLHFVAASISIHVSNRVSLALIRGGHARARYRESIALRLCRRFLYLRKPALQRRYPRVTVATETLLLLHRYLSLGVTDPPQVERESGPVPLLGSPWRVGHPLEVASWLGRFAFQFLLLHEAAHVLLDHPNAKPATNEERWTREFAADELALRMALSLTPTRNGVAAACLGSWLFLETARWLEVLRGDDDRHLSHPPASDRLKRLRKAVSTIDRAAVGLALSTVTELETIFDDWMKATEAERNILRTWEGPISRLLDQCIDQGRPEMFKDQFPRWVFLGAPPLVARSLADTRLALEDIVSADPNDVEARTRLELVQWAYSAAAGPPENNALASELDRAYKTQRLKINAKRRVGLTWTSIEPR